MAISRRQLLALGTATSTAVGLLGAGTIWSWWDTDPSDSYKSLNDEEAKMIQCIAAAAFPAGDTIPLDGKEAKLDYFFDDLLLSMTNTNRKLLKLLLHAVDKITIPSHLSAFSDLDPITHRQLLADWLAHDNHLFRGAIQSLVILLGMGYTNHPKASKVLSQYFRCGFGA